MNVQLVTRQGLPAPAPVKTDDKGKPYCEIDIACPLCGGTGETRWKSDPVCERCDGTGTAGRADKIPLFTLEHVQALDAALQAKKDRQEAERRQRWETLAQTHAALNRRPEPLRRRHRNLAHRPVRHDQVITRQILLLIGRQRQPVLHRHALGLQHAAQDFHAGFRLMRGISARDDQCAFHRGLKCC